MILDGSKFTLNPKRHSQLDWESRGFYLLDPRIREDDGRQINYEKTIGIFILNLVILIFTYASIKLIEAFFGFCVISNMQFDNTSSPPACNTLEFPPIIGILLIALFFINWVSIKKSKSIIQYLIISSPQIILLYLLFLGLFK
jgi:hypothetical protein